MALQQSMFVQRLPDVLTSHTSSCTGLRMTHTSNFLVIICSLTDSRMIHTDDTHLKVFGDHLQGDLEDRLKDGGHLLGHALLQLVDDGCKQTQHFCIPAHVHQEGCQTDSTLSASLQTCTKRHVRGSCHSRNVRGSCVSRHAPGGMSEEAVAAGMSQIECPYRNVLERMSQEEQCMVNHLGASSGIRAPGGAFMQECPKRVVLGEMWQEMLQEHCHGGLQEECCRRNVAEGMMQEACCRTKVAGAVSEQLAPAGMSMQE